MDYLFDERAGQPGRAELASAAKLDASAESVEASAGAEIIDLGLRRAARQRISTGASGREIDASLKTIEHKLGELAGAVDLARHEAAVSPLLLEGILRAVATLQHSMRSYTNGSFPPPDPAD